MTKEEYIVELRQSMKARGVYDKSLEPAIGMLASLMAVYDEATGTVTGKVLITQTSREGDDRAILNPAFQAMATAGEQIRKYMRDLGLVVAKPAGFVSQEKDNAPKEGDKLMSVISMVSGEDVTEKKKGKRNDRRRASKRA